MTYTVDFFSCMTGQASLTYAQRQAAELAWELAKDQAVTLDAITEQWPKRTGYTGRNARLSVIAHLNVVCQKTLIYALLNNRNCPVLTKNDAIGMGNKSVFYWTEGLPNNERPEARHGT